MESLWVIEEFPNVLLVELEFKGFLKKWEKWELGKYLI